MNFIVSNGLFLTLDNVRLRHKTHLLSGEFDNNNTGALNHYKAYLTLSAYRMDSRLRYGSSNCRASMCARI